MAVVWVPSPPVSPYVLFGWTLAAQVPILLTEAAVVILTLRVRDQLPAEIAAAFLVAFSLAPRYVGGRLIILGLFFFPLIIHPYLAIALLPFTAFLLARWGLYGPVVIMERHSIIGSLRISWRLVKDRTLRTLVMVLALQVGVFIVASLAELVGSAGPLGVRVIFTALGQAATLPLVTIFILLLYEDYSRLQSVGSNEFPRPPEPPPTSPPQ